MTSDNGEPERFVRFRADPSKIRVSLGKNGYGDCKVTIYERNTNRSVSAIGLNPKHAIDHALRKAKEHRFYGIDLDMQNAYEHPYYNKGI